MPLLVGGALELPLGVLAGQGRRRRLTIVGGGVLFVLTLLGVASAHSFPVLLAAFVAFYPASGAFVSLTQAEMMDARPDRQAQTMARWDLAGSAGSVAGPLLITVVLAAGGGWRAGFGVLAGLAALAWLGTVLRAPAAGSAAGDGDHADRGHADRGHADGRDHADLDRAADRDAADGRVVADGRDAGPEPAGAESWRKRAREVLAALRDRRTLRWLLLIEVGDLLVDVFTGFLALYLVDVAHLPSAVAALAVGIRLGAGLAGDAALVVILERVGDLTVLRASAAAAALLYPAFLLVHGVAAKLVILAALSAATAPWYPILTARLYSSLPGRSPVAVTLSSAAGLAGGLGPLAVGLIAQGFGLSWALTGLIIVPLVILLATAGGRSGRGAAWPDGAGPG